MHPMGRWLPRFVGLLLMASALALALSRAPDRSVQSLVARWAPPPSQFIDLHGQLVHLRDEGPARRGAAGAGARHIGQPAHLGRLERGTARTTPGDHLRSARVRPDRPVQRPLCRLGVRRRRARALRARAARRAEGRALRDRRQLARRRGGLARGVAGAAACATPRARRCRGLRTAQRVGADRFSRGQRARRQPRLRMAGCRVAWSKRACARCTAIHRA